VTDPDELYETPAWATRLIIHALYGRSPDVPRSQLWLEPCAGNGLIVRACREAGVGPTWEMVEHVERCRPALEVSAAGDVVWIGDFFTSPAATTPAFAGPPFDVVIMNPPFSRASEFVERCLPLSNRVIVLLRLNWLGSEKRAGFLHEHMPDVYVLPNRPSFIVGKQTDATEYGWMVWPGTKDRGTGIIGILEVTSKDVRKAEKLARLVEPALR